MIHVKNILRLVVVYEVLVKFGISYRIWENSKNQLVHDYFDGGHFAIFY